MAGRGAPSYLKRQKEMSRLARANEKRAARQARRDDRTRPEPPVDETELPAGPAAEPAAEDPPA